MSTQYTKCFMYELRLSATSPFGARGLDGVLHHFVFASSEALQTSISGTRLHVVLLLRIGEKVIKEIMTKQPHTQVYTSGRPSYRGPRGLRRNRSP